MLSLSNSFTVTPENSDFHGHGNPLTAKHIFSKRQVVKKKKKSPAQAEKGAKIKTHSCKTVYTSGKFALATKQARQETG